MVGSCWLKYEYVCDAVKGLSLGFSTLGTKMTIIYESLTKQLYMFPISNTDKTLSVVV